ncbi:hypothetical protein BRDID11002_63430 [Bradyrhizobium diazoefficiens]
MSATIRAAKSDGSAVWTLLFISFAYGIFHAAGPGHGKAVIASYLVANRETARRGIALSFASALMQSVVAILIVGISAWILNATAKTMCKAEGMIEIASYGPDRACSACGWSGSKAAPSSARFRRPSRCRRSQACRSTMITAITTIVRRMIIMITITMIMVTPITITGTTTSTTSIAAIPTARRRASWPAPVAGGAGFAAILTVGIRPCSGAILVLVFALAQGLFWAGIAATFLMGLGTAITVAAIAVVAVSAKDIAARLSAGRDGGGALFMRGIEFGAAGLVLLFGVGLLFGYIAAERTTCF